MNDSGSNQHVGSRGTAVHIRWWLIGAGAVMVGEGFGLGNLDFAAPVAEIALIVLISGVVVALIGAFNRMSLVAGIGVIAAAGLSMVAVVFGAFIAEVGSLLFLTGLASLVAGLKGVDLVRAQSRDRQPTDSW